MIFGPQKPFVDLSIAGAPTGWLLGGALKEFTYRDVHHGEVDEITFKLADGSGLWRGGWGIDEGTEVSGLMGYAGLLGAKVPCGLYTVGETEAQGDGGGDTAIFHAQAAFTSKELRTERSEAFEQMELAAVIQKGADRHGLEVVGDIPDLRFERLSQEKQSDLNFWTRLAEDWGCYFSVKGSQLVFTSRESIEDMPAIRHFELISGDRATRYSLRKSTHKLYAKAEAKYLHPKTKKLLKAEIEDDRVPSGDTLKLDDRAETQAHAERQATARLARENDGLGTGKITVVGDPLLVAGQVVQLGLTYGKYAGRWLVTAARHRFNASGYTTTINIKVLK
ncbi:phage late control D family protein [Tateyamaria sp.]|uniref:phage late control D family protein n=1 Tax=Tateyamaria sp. TaxID=1929288 RepID=UPI003B2248EB